LKSLITLLPIAASEFALEQVRVVSGRGFVILRRRLRTDLLSEISLWADVKERKLLRARLINRNLIKIK
jgi:hypothetical protein